MNIASKRALIAVFDTRSPYLYAEYDYKIPVSQVFTFTPCGQSFWGNEYPIPW